MTTNLALPWRSLLDAALAAHAHLPPARYAQLATVAKDGRPSNRTVVFRDFLDDGRLVFTTDARSEKVAELAASPWAELCWYFSETREQFRLLGRVTVVAETGDRELAARRRTWEKLGEDSRQSFTWPPPGRPKAKPVAFTSPTPVEPPSSFALLLLEPEEVERLDLRSRPQERTHYRRDGERWSEEAINP